MDIEAGAPLRFPGTAYSRCTEPQYQTDPRACACMRTDPAETEREVHVVRSGTHFYLGTGWVPVARELSLEPGEQVPKI